MDTYSKGTTKDLLPRLSMWQYLFYKEGKKRDISFSLYENSDGKISMRMRKNDRGFMIRTAPFSYSFVNRPPYRKTSKEMNSEMMSAADMPVPKQIGPFSSKEAYLAGKYLHSYPLIAKPNDGALSQGVIRGITDEATAAASIDSIVHQFEQPAIIEEQLFGDEFRILFIEDHYVGCVQRRQPSVTGDGKSTIQELIAKRNAESERGDKKNLRVTVHYLDIDKEMLSYLQEHDLSLASIPDKGTHVQLTRKMNAAAGTDYIDCTQKLHTDYIEMCRNFMKKYNLFVIGFDLISPDISKSPSETRSGFNEFNISPSIDLLENNNIGENYPASAIMWDHLEAKSEIWTKDFHVI